MLDGIRLASQAMAPAGGRREGRQGVLITVASAGGFFSMPFSPVYAAAKAGVVHATRSVAKPLLERNIRICALCPEVSFPQENGKLLGASQTPQDLFLQALTCTLQPV